MKAAGKRSSGMTLMEMLAAITVLMILTTILAQAFFQATKAAGHGKALAEIYQVARALNGVLAKDVSGATPDSFTSSENGVTLAPVYGLPPGPYNQPQYGVAPANADATLRRMLMGGSDYLAFSSSNASVSDKAVAKVFYVLRATGELVRVVHADTVFNEMDYRYDAVDHGVDINEPAEFNDYESRRVVAENVQSLKFSFLDRGTGPVSATAERSPLGVWVEDWDWTVKPYLPAAVKVQVQLTDHLWKTADGDNVTNRFFNPVLMDKDLDGSGALDQAEAGEAFDAGDGEAFTFIIELPLGV